MSLQEGMENQARGEGGPHALHYEGPARGSV